VRKEPSARASAPARKPANKPAAGGERSAGRPAVRRARPGASTEAELDAAALTEVESAPAEPRSVSEASGPSPRLRSGLKGRSRSAVRRPLPPAEPAADELAEAPAPELAAGDDVAAGDAEGTAATPQLRVDWCTRVGELVVDPGQGVAQIEEFGSRQIGGAQCDFLVLRTTGGASRIMIPVGKVKDVGLRPLMGPEEVQRIWKILRSRPTGRSGRQTWIRQFREYQDRIKTGTVFDIAEVLRNLLLLQKEKELSFGEHRVLDSARTLLAEELAAVERRSVEEILAEIKQLARA
jgi:CarD family transcriptional regulator